MTEYSKINEFGVMWGRFRQGLEWLINGERSDENYISFRDNVIIPMAEAWGKLSEEEKKVVVAGKGMEMVEVKKMFEEVKHEVPLS